MQLDTPPTFLEMQPPKFTWPEGFYVHQVSTCPEGFAHLPKVFICLDGFYTFRFH